MAFTFGNVITFSYIGKKSHDAHPKILVVHPSWFCSNFRVGPRCVHGIALNQVPSNYVELIKFLMQKDFKDMKDKSLYRSFYRWKNLMPKNLSPLLIYNTFISRIRPIRSVYRKYKPEHMSGVRILSSKLV